MRKRFPALPKAIHGLRGPIPILQVKAPDEKKDNLGVFDEEKRHIEIKRSLTGDQKWVTLFHEAGHSALWDSGVKNMLTEKQQEAVCDAMATLMYQIRFGGS